MRFYTRVPIWVTSRRLKLLNEFRADVERFFRNSRVEWRAGGRSDNEEAQNLRPKINRNMQQARRMIAASGVVPVIHYSPPPIVGGNRQSVDLINNLFSAHQFEIGDEEIIGFIDRAIGVYQSDRSAAILRTFNPLWWVAQVFVWLASVPFSLIGAAGFDANKVEDSAVGKLIKLLVYILSAGASLATISQVLDWL